MRKSNVAPRLFTDWWTGRQTVDASELLKSKGAKAALAELSRIERQSARVTSDRDTGSSKGFGIIEIMSNEDAQKAMSALNRDTGSSKGVGVIEIISNEDAQKAMGALGRRVHVGGVFVKEEEIPTKKQPR